MSRLCGLTPRTRSNDDSNKPDYQRTIRLTPSGRPASRIFWKMTGPWKPHSASPATPTAGPQNFMTAAGRRCSWRIWKESDIEVTNCIRRLTAFMNGEDDYLEARAIHLIREA